MKENQKESRRKFIRKSTFTGAALVIGNFIPEEILNSNNSTDQISELQYRNAFVERQYLNTSKKIPEIRIDTNFENGHLDNFKIVGPDTISIGPVSQHKDTWFSFSIKGVKNKRITMIFEWINSQPLPKNFNGAVNNTGMVTYDGKGFEIIKDVRFTFKEPSSNTGNYLQTMVHTFREDEALVSYCAPWSNTRLAKLVSELKTDSRVQIDSIGLSKFKKLPLTYLRITDRNFPDSDKKKFFLIAREDSYEAGGSWAAEGLIKFILSDDPVAIEMLKKMVFVIFPIFSVDGVAIGSTNYPLDPENSKFVYVTADWDKDPAYHEVQLMKDFWDKLKNESYFFDVCFKLHSTCYWECHFRPEDCAEHNLGKERELLGLLRSKLSWRIEAGPHRNSKPYMNYNFIKIFPEAITFSSHNDFIFTGRYLGIEKPVYRRHEDVMQDGELIARCFAEFYGISGKEVAPYLMAGDVDKNCGRKGEEIKYSVYYYDINQLPPVKIEVVINNKSYRMTTGQKTDYKKPVLFTCNVTLKKPLNNYFFLASNGLKERRIPEEDYMLPGPFILK
jgi:hypothetical protein